MLRVLLVSISGGVVRRMASEVLDEAIGVCTSDEIDLFTFSFYLDHESRAVSVCIDTDENSFAQVREQNRRTGARFAELMADPEAGDVALWQPNLGRNTSLGDFTYVNLARRAYVFPHSHRSVSDALLRTLFERQAEIVSLSRRPDQLLLSASTPDDEFGICWFPYDQISE